MAQMKKGVKQKEIKKLRSCLEKQIEDSGDEWEDFPYLELSLKEVKMLIECMYMAVSLWNIVDSQTVTKEDIEKARRKHVHRVD